MNSLISRSTVRVAVAIASLLAATPAAQEFRDALEVNLVAPFLFTKAVLPTMQAQRYGRIVNVSSLAGRTELVVRRRRLRGKEAAASSPCVRTGACRQAPG